MIAYVFGAGASAHANDPVARNLLQELSIWLEGQNTQAPRIEDFRNRFVQLRALFCSLDDFEEILQRLATYGNQRVEIKSDAPQAGRGVIEDVVRGETNDQSNFFYQHSLRGDLVSAVREFFYDLESHRAADAAYDCFAQQRVSEDDTLITFNYDVSLESALKRAGRWDIGSGYGFTMFADRPRSSLTLFKLHGSVNWFQAPMQNALPPLMFSRDLELLGYQDVRDSRIRDDVIGVNETGTLILPDTDKQFYWEHLWQPLWESAAARLRGVEELFVHGYSMPPADARARRLLFDNVNPGTPIHIFCRGASEGIASEFRQAGFSDVRPNSEVRFEVWASDRPVGGSHS